MDISKEKILSNMTLEEKIGQMFQVGFSATKITPGVKEMIEEYYAGGIIYFRRNIESLEQVSNLSNELQRLAMNRKPDLPLLISTDQEGGMVNRLENGTHFPGNMTIGATRQPGLAEKAGKAIASQLKAVGINMDFAPVMDVNNNPLNIVIGARSFGGDAELVAEMGAAFIKGMQEEGTIACAKHFPGHGNTAVDSHLELPVIECDREHLEKVEIYPFKEAVKAGVDSIMTAHIYVPSLEPREGIPATLSSNILTGLLREKMGYKGVIITDCMEMKAIYDNFGTVEGAVMAIEAGADIILISHSLDKQKAAIEETIRAVKEGRITEERISQSVLRILDLKRKRIGLKDLPDSDYRKINKEIEEKIAYEISKEGVTLSRDESNLIPIGNNYRKILVIDFPAAKSSPAEDETRGNNLLIDFLRKERIDVRHVTIAEKDERLSVQEGIDLIIVCTCNILRDTYQVKVIKELQDTGTPVIVISANPYDFKVLPGAATILTIYDYSPFNLRVASEIITGKYKAKGTLPVTL
jgi:beta-N-acetylhexosaminidase